MWFQHRLMTSKTKETRTLAHEHNTPKGAINNPKRTGEFQMRYIHIYCIEESCSCDEAETEARLTGTCESTVA